MTNSELSPTHDPNAPEPIGVLAARAVSSVARRWRLFMAVLVLCALASAAHWFSSGRDYVSEARYRPSTSGGDLSRLSGLAAQFGVDAALPAQDESIDFYAELSRSREVLEALATHEYRFRTKLGVKSDSMHGNLLQLYHIKGETPRRRMTNIVDRLEHDIAVSTSIKANIVTIRAAAPWGELSEQIGAELLQQLNAFNLKRRQSKGAAERAFVQAQVARAQNDLLSAENNLEQFLEANRRFDKSPDLTFQRERLGRRVELFQSVYTSLTQSLEKARIDEVRNTPVITVVESPAGSARRAGSLVRALIFGLLPGIMLAFAAVLAADHLAQAEQQRPEEFAQFARFRGKRKSRAG